MIVQSMVPRFSKPLALAFTTLFALVLSSGCSSPGFETSPSDSVEPATYSYTIPQGAGLAFDSGQPLEILPAELNVRVGENIEIVNADDRGHTIGIWFVGAGETLRQTFTSAGELEGACSVHPSGAIKVTVTQ